MDQPVQLSVLEAGCQPWNFQVVAASGDRFAYCATLSVYVFQRHHKTNHYTLHSIITEHKRGITSICWHPADNNIICTTSCDKSVILWHVERQAVIVQLSNIVDYPIASSFSGGDIAFATKSAIYLWKYEIPDCKALTPKEYNVTFTSPITAMQFCERSNGKVIIGHSNGTVSVLATGKKAHRNFRITSTDEDDEETEAMVTEVRWDPHSADYALVVSYQCDLVMLDTCSMQLLVRYTLPSKAAHVQTIAWVPDASGVFVTGDQQSGVLRLWNVSNSEPIKSQKVKANGFHAMAAIKKPLPSTVDSDKHADFPASGNQSVSSLSCPPTYLVCTFGDGGVGLYDLEYEKWTYLREKGHIETVFDCKFSPLSCHRLATASFDGSVKIWDTSKPQLVCESSSPGNEGILYQVSWAPQDLNCIAVASAKYGVLVWDVGTGRITKRYHEHGKSVRVYTVCWNQLNSTKILSGGGDKFAIVRDVDGSNVIKFAHAAAVFGCQWSPSNQSLFATGSADGKVRIFHLPSGAHNSTALHQPVKVFEGHSYKSFHIIWSPLRDGYLASGSDDMTIRVWSYGDDKCVQVLQGHTSNVRGLCWSPEIAYILYSGSWDNTIIVWDIRTGTRLATLTDHSDDVYGLAIHKDQPFILASCSRDSTVRLWSTYQVVSLLPIGALANQWKEVFASAKVAMGEESPPLLSGRLSSSIYQKISRKSTSDHSANMYRLHQLFQYAVGVENLIDLVRVLLRKPQSSLSSNYMKGIVHSTHLMSHMQSEANELDMARLGHTGGQIGAPSRQDRIQQAANAYLRLGNLQKYCQLLVESNQWEKALSIAPAVSLKYWQSLLCSYTSHLRTHQPSKLLPYQTAQRKPEQLVSYHLHNGACHDALLAAVVGAEAAAPSATFTANSAASDSVEEASKSQRLLLDTIQKVAEYYIDSGQPLLSSCIYLSGDMIEEAICTLIQSNMLELAFTLASALKSSSEMLATVVERLAYRCERLGALKLAIDILRLVEGTEEALVKLCIRNMDRLGELIAYHDSVYNCIVELPDADTAGKLLLSSTSLPAVDRIRLLLLSNNHSDGLKLSIETVCSLMGRASFTLTQEVLTVLQYAQSVPSVILNKHPVLLFDLVTLSCYIGALNAIHRGYDVIVSHLLQLTVKRLSFDHSTDIPLNVEEVRRETLAWMNKRDGKKADLVALYKKSRHNEEGRKGALYGEMYTTGCTLPRGSSRGLVSLVTGRRIVGAAYTLEDSTSSLSLAEALMWFNINPFSPISCSQSVAVANKMSPY